MFPEKNMQELIQYHNGISHFDYNLVVDWAIGLIEKGIETDNVLMLASFQKPVDSREIKPYLSNVLKDFNLAEDVNEKTLHGYIHVYLKRILNNESIRKNLRILHELYLDEEFHKNRHFDHGLSSFSDLYWSWDGLDEHGENYYYEGATSGNIEDLVKKEAALWIDEYIHGIKPKIETTDENTKPEKKKSFLVKIKKLFS